MKRLLNVPIALLLAGCGAAPKPTVEPTERPIERPAPEAPKAEAPDSAPPPAADAAPASEAEELLTPGQVAGRERLAEGRKAALRGDLDAAVEAFRDALSEDEDLAEARYNLGVIAEWKGDLALAREQYEKATEARLEFEPPITAVANLHLREGKRDLALSYAQRLLSRKPGSLALRNAVNRVHLEFEGRSAQVVQDTKKILREDEKNVPAMINLAAAYAQQGKYELSVAILDNAKALDPKNPEIHARAALAHQALGENIKARLTLEEAIALPGGGTAEIHNNLGLVYHAAGDYEGAEGQFKKALARWPGMLSAQINLGNALRGQQRYTDAVKAFLRALKMDPASPDAYFNLGILYLDGDIPEVEPIRRFEKSVTYFERYKQLRGAPRPGDPVEQYIAEARKRIDVEQKRAAQLRQQPKTPAPEPDEGGDEPPDDDGGDDDAGGAE